MKSLLTLALILLLNGCSSLSPQQHQLTEPTTWTEYQQQMQALKQWQIDGKVAFRNGQNRESASFIWQQNSDQFDIRLLGPLNQLGAKISGDSSFVELYADGETYQARSPERLLEQQLGWQLPIRNIQWWIKAIPAPGSVATSTFANQRLQLLKQQGWQISYQRYAENNAYPEKIKISRETMIITLIIKRWSPE